MSALRDELCLLDTNVIIHLARDDATGGAIEAAFRLSERREIPLLSTIVEGEVLALARAWGWGPSRTADLTAILEELVRVDAGLPEVVGEYARLYAAAASAGRMPGENDLWITATASAAGAVLYTCDADFEWFHPDYIQVRNVLPE